MLNFIFILVAIAFFTSITAQILFKVFRSKLAVEERIEHFLYTKSSINEQRALEIKGKQRKWYESFTTYWNIGVEFVNRRISNAERKKIEYLLRDAGYPFSWSAIEFRFFQLLVSVSGGFISFLLFYSIAENKAVSWLITISVAFTSYRYTILYLSKKRAARIKEIDKAMPDFFDTINLLLEAGMGLDGAIVQVCQQTKGPLSDEFSRALEDMRLGKSRREAFYDLRKRVPSDSLQSIMNSLIQADQLGIGMAKVLRNLTGRIREQRREAAREQAMKAPVKMLFPMVMFIFPALFIVILGPVAIQLITKGIGG
jgi:tight adherence protein C